MFVAFFLKKYAYSFRQKMECVINIPKKESDDNTC